MNAYEGMFIFPDALKDEALEEAVGRVRAEIEKLGGGIDNITRLGKRAFARPLAERHTSGHYVVVNFQLAGDHVAPLRERLRLAGEVFRMQIVRAEPAGVVKEASNGGAE